MTPPGIWPCRNRALLHGVLVLLLGVLLLKNPAAQAYSQDEDLTFEDEGLVRLRRDLGDASPVPSPTLHEDEEEADPGILSRVRRQFGGWFGYPDTAVTDAVGDDEDMGSGVIEGSGFHQRTFRVKLHLLTPWRQAYSNKDSQEYVRTARSVQQAMLALLNPVPGEKIIQVSDMKQATRTGNILVTVDIMHADDTDQKNRIRQLVRGQLERGELGGSPVNVQFFSFDEPRAPPIPPACPPEKHRCREGRCVGRCDGLPECLDGSDEFGCTTDAGSLVTSLPPSCSGDAAGPFLCRDNATYACFCDGKEECPGGEDEDEERCFAGCEPGTVSCDFGTQCIPESRICDGVPDCQDGTDEPADCPPPSCLSNQFRCQSGKCIEDFRRCDYIEDCPGGEDELSCPPEPGCTESEFTCGDGLCIDGTQRCNGLVECRDGSDEDGCPCRVDQWECGDGTCLPGSSRCDGTADCRDASDEQGCPPKACQAGEWTCRDGSCIPGNKRCDQFPDCVDRSDEENCPTQGCSAGEFTCEDGSCIPEEQRCDGQYDCDDSSDEADCPPTACGVEEWTCRDGTCIPNEYRCDRQPDCPDYTDEENCPPPECDFGEWTCRDGSCIPQDRVCDRQYDCPDYSDEDRCPGIGCRPGEWTCGDGSCIPEGRRCDGRPDCSDRSDELGCEPTQCRPGEWQCRNRECRPASDRCDGVPQCVDRSDEENCPPPPPPRCQEGEITCGDGSCVPGSARCNNILECPDGTDERDCTACQRDEFRCADGLCIPSYLVCDGRPYCRDGSDEANCLPPCSGDEFRCGDGQCIPQYLVCDRQPHCRDGSDERDCPTESLCRPPDGFRCGNGFCIAAARRCDGTRDCQDSSDEENCPPPPCRPDQFRCEDGMCLDIRNRCNGYPDCRGGEDERGCPCGSDQFRCERDGYCISNQQLCDGRRDCSDGTDEVNCGCSLDEWQCLDGQCIPVRYRCDGRADCRDGSDETVNCPPTTQPPPTPPHNSCRGDQFECKDGSCVARGLRCDGIPDCDDGSDETIEECTRVGFCSQNQFACSSGECVGLDKRCDQNYDCLDRSDERGCPPNPGNKTCTEAEFTCSDGDCIEKAWRCDNVPDCMDGSDEDNCCQSNEFQCGDGQCIPEYLRCDKKYDCTDGSDERENCECGANEFTCQSGECIPASEVCDGYPRCQDGSDERNCRTSQCSPNEFSCGSGDCVPEFVVCDGKGDCIDGSDESSAVCATCRPDEFECRYDRSCVSGNARCDGVPDCLDASDESGCPTPRPNPNFPPVTPCRADEYMCPNGRCIPQVYVCDGTRDCEDGADETSCTPTTIRPPVTTTRPRLPPPNSVFQCNDGRTIDDSLRCNGRFDCSDGSDEADCEGLNLKLYPEQQTIQQTREVVFQCRDEGPIRAPVRWVRDNNRPLPPRSTDVRGRLTMPNIQVEHSGTYFCEAQGVSPNMAGRRKAAYLQVNPYVVPTIPTTPVCSLNEATCMDGQCIPKDKVCDGVYDCRDTSDEMRCNPLGCEPNEFQCDNKKCVLKTWLCDSDNDCGDGSDEATCPEKNPDSACSSYEFSCQAGNQCIPKSFHCDGEIDCQDGTDERGCSKPIVIEPPPRNVVVQILEDFTLTCAVIGVPTPTVIWRLNWGHVPSKCRMTSEDGRGTLYCPSAQPTDQGAYSCEAINTHGSVFAQPDAILQVRGNSPAVCVPPQFNAAAYSVQDCLTCFCFGATDQCYSSDRFVTQLPPPRNDAFTLVGVNQNQIQGNFVIRDREYPLSRSNIISNNFGVQLSVDRTKLGGPSDLIIYFSLPETHTGEQLTAYGGFLRYKIRYQTIGAGQALNGPDVIIKGNGLTLMYVNSGVFRPDTVNQVDAEFTTGQWFKRVTQRGRSIQAQEPASREEIMMVLADMEFLLIRALYNDGLYVNTTLYDVQLDTAVISDSTQSRAVYVEVCRCPEGYTGMSCQDCAPNYRRVSDGPWLGRCVPQQECGPNEYGDPARNIQCLPCPCPLSTPTNQFSSSCYLANDGQVTCNCQQGYQGRRCEYCAAGYTGNPQIPGDSCQPDGGCSREGSQQLEPLPSGYCQCKAFTTGPKCDQCKANSFYIHENNRDGCIPCFCMGITSNCSSSNWYRQQESVSFTNSRQGFELVDRDQKKAINSGLNVDSGSRELIFREFSLVGQEVLYWKLPARFLGNKVTSYGGYLTYSLRYVPSRGEQISTNNAYAVEIFGNDITLRHYSFPNVTVSPSRLNTFRVPMYEQFWERQNGQLSNREHFLMALADLKYILIKATYATNTDEVALKEVTLDYAEPRNTGLARAYAVEMCGCPEGYNGLSCEDCAIGYTRSLTGIYLGTCVPCDCSGRSEECDPETGECSNCRGNTAGPYCERCAPGYEERDGSCVRRNSQNCNCDPRGQQGPCSADGQCQCKANVFGDSCDTCRPGFFRLTRANPDGCLECWCSGVTSECFSSNYYRIELPMQLFADHGFSFSDRPQINVIRDNLYIDQEQNQISFTNFNDLPDSQTYYWSLPQMFTGNRLASYGGNLSVTQWYETESGDEMFSDSDIIIRSSGGREFIWMNPTPLRPNEKQPYSVLLTESSFTVNQQLATREEFLEALSSVEAILIRATLSNRMRATHLQNVIMDTAVPSSTGQPRALDVEQCKCPREYVGLSCEQCRPGHYRDRTTNRCIQCPCNGREESCTQLPSGAVECNCLPGYYGTYCTRSEPTTDDRPKIRVIVSEPVIRVDSLGSTVELRCSATSLTGPQTRLSVIWSKAEGQLPYGRSTDNRQGTLTISNVRTSDGGVYICAAVDGLGHTESANVTLVVPGSGNPRVVLSEDREVLELQLGGTLEVRCSGEGNPPPRVIWSFGAAEDLPPNSSQQNGLLIIRNAQSVNSGEYFCTATNNLGSSYARIVINVMDRQTSFPGGEVQISQSTVETQPGDTVRVSCSAALPGRFIIDWTRRTNSLPAQAIITSGELTIPNAQPVDSGIYVCRITDLRTSSFREASTRILIIAVPVGSMPTVRMEPERLTISQGNSMELRCATTGDPRPTITWTKAREIIGPNVILEGPVLRISNAMVSDRGMYICTAQNDAGSAQAAAIVEVERREPPVIQIYPKVQQTIVVGASALFQCHLTSGIPTPTVRWSRADGRPMTSNTETLNGGVLRFNQVQGDEEGSYICTAENDAGSVTAIAMLEVQSMPSITIRPGPSPYMVQEGERLRLECSAEGDPAPAVSWQRLQVNFPTNIPSRSTSPTIAVYEIGSVSKSDEGTYQCSARNDAGVSEERIQVVVTQDSLPGWPTRPDVRPPRLPYRPDTDDIQRIVVPYGGSSEFTCSSRDPNADNIQYSFRRTDGEPFSQGVVVRRDGVMELSNVDETASGEYACVGTDRVTGSVLFTVYYFIEVLAPPRISLDPARQIVRPNDRVQIRCTATGAQPITITWSKEVGYMPPSVVINGGELTFRGIKTTDEGRYVCTAVNSAGTTKAVAEVIVNEEPLLTAIEPEVTLYVGQSAELRCEMSGINPNDVTWTRIGGRLPLTARPSANILRIPRVQPEDSGNYQCDALTPTGTRTSDVITLTVQRQRMLNIVVRSIPPRVQRGQNVDLVCDVDGDRTAASISWRRMDGRLPRGHRLDGNTLRIPRVEESGTYRCIVTTPQGVFEKTYALVIRDIEQLDFGTGDQRLRSVKTRSASLGEGVTMDCQISLPGPVSYTWSKQGGSLPFKSVSQNTMLNIPDLGVEDAGLYVCTGRNNERSVDLLTLLVVADVIPRFEESSYISLATIPRAYLNFDIEISFKPDSPNGLLLYNSQYSAPESGDYVALGLKDGYAEFRFNVGSGPAVLRSSEPLTLGEWHTIKISRNRKDGTMVVNGGKTVVGSSPGKLMGLDLVAALYLGGVPDFAQLPVEAGYTSGLRGCISRLIIGNNRNYDFIREAREKVGVRGCDTCSTNPCQNNGVCQEAFTSVGHKCFCPAGFSGPLCEDSGESCYPGVCGSGRCVNRPGGFECYCPFGKLGERCEQDITIYEPAFGDESYIAYPTPRARRWFSVNLNFMPETLDDGVLMYCAQKERDPGDFASLAIRNKRLEFRFNTGSGTAKIESEPIRDGEWIEVYANRTDRFGSMRVNDGPMVNGESPGSTRGLNLLTPLFIGGVDNSRIQISPDVEVSQGFRGCVSQIKLMGQEVALSEALVDSANVDQCGGSPCGRSPCQNQGQCTDDSSTPAGYICTCPEGYSGHDCENAPGVCTIVQPCKNGAACVGSGEQYFCRCPIGFAGQHCETRVMMREMAQFSGDGWVEFNQTLLNQGSDSSQAATFEFTTRQPEGLLLWLGQEADRSGRSQDYMSVAVRGGFVEFSYELGGGSVSIRSTARVDNGRRHRLSVVRNGQEGSLTLDDNPPQRDISPGQLHVLNSQGNVYVGGLPDYEVMTGGSHTQGFFGCLHRLTLGSRDIDSYMNLALAGVNVTPCQRFRGRKRGPQRG